MKKLTRIKYPILIGIFSILILGMNSCIVFAEEAQVVWWYDEDGTFEDYVPLYFDSISDFQELKVEYDFDSEIWIVTGVEFYYASLSGSGPHLIDIVIDGDSYSLTYEDLEVDYSASGGWYDVTFIGPNYLLDNDPSVIFDPKESSSNCFGILYETTTEGHSYFRHDGTGGSWIEDSVEYVVGLYCEPVNTLLVNSFQYGTIDNDIDDFVDAYFVTLNAGTEYRFELDGIPSTGKLNMTLYENGEITDTSVASGQADGDDPGYMKYTPSSSGTYILLIEPETIDVDEGFYTIDLYENKEPIADFEANNTEMLEGQYVQFTFNGTLGDTPMKSYEWNFGDGSTSSDENPMHQYTNPGTFKVNLTVIDEDDDVSTIEREDFIVVTPNTIPDPDFISNVTTLNQWYWVNFTYTGIDGNLPLNYEWDFGDGSPISNDENPMHQYTTAGTFTVNLTVIDANGDMANETKYSLITVNPNILPTSNFTADITSIIQNEYINFAFTGNEGDTPTDYEWDFGDGSPISNDENPIHQYTAIGTFTVSLTITDDDGEFDTEIKTNYITVEADSIPEADFSVNNTEIIENQYVQFTYTGIGGNLPLSYEWDFGDGSTNSSDENPIHQYTTTGTYTVTLKVTDIDKDVNYEVKTDYIIVEADTIPDPDFISNVTTLDQWYWVNFTYTGVDGNLPLNYEWDFGDGSPISNDENPMHQYITAGTFTVNLTVIDANGDMANETKYSLITVNPNSFPITDFTANATSILVTQSVQFTFTGNPGDIPTIYEWDFGDGSPISNDENPIHQYTAIGTFTVSLTITDDDDETDTEIKIAYIVVEEPTNEPVIPPTVPGYDTIIILATIGIIGSIIIIYKKRSY